MQLLVCEVIRKGPWEFQGRVTSALTRTRDGMQRLCQKYEPKQSCFIVVRFSIHSRADGEGWNLIDLLKLDEPQESLFKKVLGKRLNPNPDNGHS